MERFTHFKEFVFKRFPEIKEAEWELIRQLFRPKDVEKGDHFLREGEICKEICFIHTGFLRTYGINPEGREKTYHFAFPETFITSFESFRGKKPATDFIIAEEDTKLLCLSSDGLEKLFRESPIWEKMYRVILEEVYSLLEAKHCMMQTKTAPERYDWLLEHSQPILFQKARLGDIATYLGITQETLSRVRKEVSG